MVGSLHCKLTKNFSNSRYFLLKKSLKILLGGCLVVKFERGAVVFDQLLHQLGRREHSDVSRHRSQPPAPDTAPYFRLRRSSFSCALGETE